MGDAGLSVSAGVPHEETVIEISARRSLGLGDRISWHFEARMVAQARNPAKPCKTLRRKVSPPVLLCWE
jgi:hypothetical protein